jgi:hypothetical protein
MFSRTDWSAFVMPPCFVAAIAAVLVLAMTSGGLSAADQVILPTADSTTVLHNPAMGFVTYSGCNRGQFDKPEWIFGNPLVVKYSNIIYIRVGWSALEPSEGNYAWVGNASFKTLVKAIRDHRFRLTFRVIVQDESGTPGWVLDAVKADGKNPMSAKNPKFPDVTNPIWQKKFEKFILAFGEAFDDPALVDYIDANGLGLWGEGNLSGITGKEQEEAYYDWHLGLYARAFKRVLLAPNFGMMGANVLSTDERLAFRKYGTIFRLDGLGSQYPSEEQRAFVDKYFPELVLIGEKCYSFSGGWEKDQKITAKTAPAAPTLRTYMEFLLDQAMARHVMTLDFSDPKVWIEQNPEMAARFVANIGYRLRPKQVTFPEAMPNDGSMTIRHVWCNDAVGALPNLNRRWTDGKTGKGKYRVAFALFKPSEVEPVKVSIDPTSDPGAWVKGSEASCSIAITWDVPRQAYDLGVGIVDTTAPAYPSLDLAIKDLERRNGWYILGNLR